jgi:hypothetical protein
VRLAGKLGAALMVALLVLAAWPPVAALGTPGKAHPAAGSCCCGDPNACLCSRLPAGRGCSDGTCRLQRQGSGNGDELEAPRSPTLRPAAAMAEAGASGEPGAPVTSPPCVLPDDPPHTPEPPPPKG